MEVQVDFYIALLKMMHRKQSTIPTLDDSVILTSGAEDWQPGALVEIAATGLIDKPFAITHIGFGVVSATQTVYEIELFAGAEGQETEICQTRAFRQAQQSGSAPSPCPSEILPAGTRISARCATQGTGAETIGIAIFYNTFAGVPT